MSVGGDWVSADPLFFFLHILRFKFIAFMVSPFYERIRFTGLNRSTT